MGRSGLPEASRSGEQTDATPETVATDDVAVAFAALQAELTSLLGGAELRANEELREDNLQNRSSKQLDVIADKADHLREEAAAGTESANAAIDKTESADPNADERGSYRDAAQTVLVAAPHALGARA